MSTQVRDVKKRVLALRNGNPEAFENFLNDLNDITIEAMKALTEAPTDQVLMQQGRCQQLRSFMRLFVECDKKTDEPTPQ